MWGVEEDYIGRKNLIQWVRLLGVAGWPPRQRGRPPNVGFVDPLWVSSPPTIGFHPPSLCGLQQTFKYNAPTCCPIFIYVHTIKSVAAYKWKASYCWLLRCCTLECGFAFLRLSPRDRFPSESRWAMTLLPLLPSGCHINGADNSTNQIQKQILNDFETIGF